MESYLEPRIPSLSLPAGARCDVMLRILVFRIDGTIQELEAQQRDKLKKWDKDLAEVNHWVEETRPKVERAPKPPQNVEEALEQVDLFQVPCNTFISIRVSSSESSDGRFGGSGSCLQS